ncbi:MAG: sigma-54 dependent transcriptional regulator [Pirellulales bacterium]|nr:sigma-54 dependent transcriptional regulator [Thermoguttaceae bacterium]MDD4788644.1 sigma-54 dependent transcriptional regulator [Pirellulales bacterium]MDI9445528.1 sigma-54 dependent transcriptional regulator [Planctomycetota bacterium]NLZ03318.1 sigma-54-dependent Fis family transcriptional regulator [Pirellulaceae bacterium]
MTARRRVLIVDDEKSQRDLLEGFLQSLGLETAAAASGEQALAELRSAAFGLVLLDVRLPGMSGLEALPEIHAIAPELPVLLITAYGELRQAVAAVKSGAVDYLVKPVDLDELEAVIADTLGTEAEDRKGPEWPLADLPEGLILESPAMRHVAETVAVVARSNVPVLVMGESGTGKEVVAQLLHRWSERSSGPLVAANCAGLSETLIESELFGHTKGAFTGAAEARQGLFRAADGGTLFLDEIGELPLHLQPKLLRAIETGKITPVGADAPIDVDARLVAATNQDLGEAVEAGRFRDDLYYRINVIELVVPPLSERRDDVVPLAHRFALEFSAVPVRFSPQAVQTLLAYAWPGNVRELRNAIQRACLLSRGDVIMPDHLPPRIAGLAGPVPAARGEGRLSQVERATILATLAECGGNRTIAAKKLGISRRTLIYKLRAIEADDG